LPILGIGGEMMSRYRAAIFLMLCLPFMRAGAESAGDWQGPQQIWRSVCAYCHTTGVGPVLQGRALDPAYIIGRARHGYRAMPAFKPSEFSDQELESLAKWIHDSKLPEVSGK